MADDLGAGELPTLAAAPEPVRVLNSLLRGEIAAAETYRIAIGHFTGSKPVNDAITLQAIQQEHIRAAQVLRDRITSLGGEATENSGLWGMWAKFAEGVSSLFGSSAVIQTLKEGEEHGLRDYQQSIASLDVASATLIEEHAIPAQQRHIETLAALLA